MPCYTKICFAYGSITLYSSFFQIKKRQVPFEFRRVKVVLRTWPFVYTTSLRSIPARRKFSAWALVTFLFIRHYSGNHRYFLFPLHLLRCFNSVGCSYLNWNINGVLNKLFILLLFFKFIKINFINQKNTFCVFIFYIQLNILIKTKALVRVIFF